jgi:hypothetical protein
LLAAGPALSAEVVALGASNTCGEGAARGQRRRGMIIETEFLQPRRRPTSARSRRPPRRAKSR